MEIKISGTGQSTSWIDSEGFEREIVPVLNGGYIIHKRLMPEPPPPPPTTAPCPEEPLKQRFKTLEEATEKLSEYGLAHGWRQMS